MQVKNIFGTKRQAIEQAKTTVLAAVVLASIVVSFSLVTLNFLWNLRGYNTRVTVEKEKARDQLEVNVENSEILVEQFELFEQGEVKSQEVLDALPSKYDYAALVTSIDQLAKRSGLIMSSFSGDDLSQDAISSAVYPEPIDMPFSITVEGTYKDLQEFIGNLAKSIRPMKVELIEITGSNADIKAVIDISTYYQPKTDINVETKVVK